MKTLRLILSDQLSSQHSWFQQVRSDVVYALIEIPPETNAIKHHVQKLLATFAAMRAFAAQLREAGHRVEYVAIDDVRNQQQLDTNLTWLISKYQATHLGYPLPDNYQLDVQLRAFCQQHSIAAEATDTEHFYTTRHELQQFFEGKKQLVMETFYRYMRRKHQILLEKDGKPVGGQWNFDQENRKKWKGEVDIPATFPLQNDCREIKKALDQANIPYIGTVDAQAVQWPITSVQALHLLRHFLETSLAYFGTYQDAMTIQSWYLFHSRISFALNVKLITPQEVIKTTINYWQEHQNVVSIAQVEGFVRQILGWREFMRGVYWAYMPDYAAKNYFGHTRSLPQYYWTGNTKMRCMQHAITQSLSQAYAHHIQRLMVTGNFALLAGIHPDAVDAWYLGIYIDALQWVEITNTRGMSQFADGGIVATKPYISSANYIHRMSDYCSDCYYDPKQRHGDRACPFNSLYWHFFVRHRDLLQRNRRVSMVYHLVDKMPATERKAIMECAAHHLANLEEL
ncbi:MAG: cryptochrome/photolyase family protein [Bacteroidota bacterium]